MEKYVKIEVKEMPELNVAYIQHIGPYKGDTKLFAGLFGKLMGWAGPRGLLTSPETMVCPSTTMTRKQQKRINPV